MANRLQELTITKVKHNFPADTILKVESSIKTSYIFEFGGKVIDTENTVNWIEVDLTPEENEILKKLWDRLEASYKDA